MLFVSENHKVISSPLVAQINMERELLFHEADALVVLWVTRDGYNRLRMDAPDFMDWVVASFVFENDGEANVQKLSFDIPRETTHDRSQAFVNRLKDKAAQLKNKTVRFEQGTRFTIKDKKEYFNLLLALIDVYKDLYDLANAQKTLGKAYNLAKENYLANGYEFGKLLISWGDIETNLGHLVKALQLFEEALQHFELLEDKHSISVCFERLGETHTELGNLGKALKYFEDYSRLKKELFESNPQNVDFKNGLAISYEKLGSTHSSIGNLDKALKYFEEGSRLGKELFESNQNNVGFKNLLAISYQYLGNTYTSLGNLDKALKYFEDYSRLEKELFESNQNNVGFKNGLAISYSKLGDTHKSLGNLDKALKYFEDDLKLSKELFESNQNNVGFKNGLAISFFKLGVFYRDEKKDKIVALKYFQNAKQLLEALAHDFSAWIEFQNNLKEVTNVIENL